VIEIGSVWDDKDPRHAGRTVEVMAIEDGKVQVRMNTAARNVSTAAIGRRTKIRLDRLEAHYRPSDEPARRFSAHKDTGEHGYWPIAELA
jgi:hypothetical protein